MKRSICVFAAVLICLLSLLPVAVYAETYSLSDTDLSVQMDDTVWYVFTRDNLNNNPELEEFGISYETMHGILYDNSAYMDALLHCGDGDYIELFIRKTAQTTELVNLSNYSDEDVMTFAAELAEYQNTQEYSIYKTQYKFSKAEYFDANANLYLYEFCTVVNNQNYVFTFQSPSEFTDEKCAEAQKIIDSIRFNVDLTLKEPTPKEGNIVYNALGGAVAGGIAGGIIALVNKKKKKVNSYGNPDTPTEVA